MNKIRPINFEFVHLDNKMSQERTDQAYARLFRQAWKNIVDKQSTQKYSERVYE